jgi:3-oxoacyl-(acyl-carrier-protein) synthase
MMPAGIFFECPDCDLDYIPNVARNQQVDVAVRNNAGFGSHNAVIVMKRYHG